MIKSCTFIGQRPSLFSYGYDEEDIRCLQLKKTLKQYIQLLYTYGIREFYTGCALGVELWAAEIVLELQRSCADIALFCVIPYEEQASRWSVDQRDRYYEILEQCTKSVTLSQQFSNECIGKKNNYLISHTDIVMAVYEESSRRSSVAHVVEYAKIKRRGIIIIDPETLEVTPLMSNLVSHRI